MRLKKPRDAVQISKRQDIVIVNRRRNYRKNGGTRRLCVKRWPTLNLNHTRKFTVKGNLALSWACALFCDPLCANVSSVCVSDAWCCLKQTISQGHMFSVQETLAGLLEVSWVSPIKAPHAEVLRRSKPKGQLLQISVIPPCSPVCDENITIDFLFILPGQKWGLLRDSGGFLLGSSCKQTEGIVSHILVFSENWKQTCSTYPAQRLPEHISSDSKDPLCVIQSEICRGLTRLTSCH